MNSHAFRSKGPELLVELAHHVADTIVDVTGLDLKVAEQVGSSVATRMMLVWGGRMFISQWVFLGIHPSGTYRYSVSLMEETIASWQKNIVYLFSGFIK